ncbi:MAG TPA: zinc-ribbon domain-containing protein [Polyangiaceae bacterium]|nr:zinc-ribbon domain-containing protein [Polyangiaceae bacterium]
MKITCHSCGAKYTIADNKVSGRRVKVRCRSCGTPIVVDGQLDAGASQPDAFEQAPSSSAEFSDRLSSIELPRTEAEGWSVNLSDTEQRTMSTAEIVDGFRNGTLNDAYVWRDGMADWLPVLDVVELRDAIEKQRSSAASVPRRSQPAPASARGQTPLAARVSGGRARGGTDLFGSVESAGSEAEAFQESAVPAFDQRPSGARNENSVLFSLDALKAGFSAPAPPPPRAQTQPQDFAVSNEDPFGMSKGNSGLSGIAGGSFSFDNQALLTAPAAPLPREPAKPVATAMDVAPGLVTAPLSTPKKAPSKSVIAIGAALVLLLVVGIVVALSGASDEDTAKKETPTEPLPEAKKAPEEPAAVAEKPATKPAEPPKKEPAAQPAAETSATPPPAATPDKPSTPAADDKKKLAEPVKKKEEPKTTKKEEPKPAVVAGEGPPFNRGAAIAALSSASGSVSGCKKAGGPTGSGKVLVTFAPSGRVTSANVSAGSFGGTGVGGCVASVFRRARVPAFGGGPVTVSKSFTIR